MNCKYALIFVRLITLSVITEQKMTKISLEGIELDRLFLHYYTMFVMDKVRYLAQTCSRKNRKDN